MEEILLLGLIVLLVMHFRLRSLVHSLEERIDHLLSSKTAPANPQAAGQSAIPGYPPPLPSSPPPSHQTINLEPDIVTKTIHWLKEDWLLKLGALLLLIGFGWLTTYAFLNNWIGPMGRIAFGIIAGALILTLGYWRIRNFVQQGSVFIVLGSTTILLTIYAARLVYDFFTPGSALLVMFLCSVLVAFASVRFKVQSLAISGLILAGIAPLLTESPAPDHIALFSYLFIVILGSIWIVALTGWRNLTLVALAIYALYSASVMADRRLDNDIFLLFAFAFTAVFFITDALGILKIKDKNLNPDLIAAGANGLLLLAWVLTTAAEEWQSLIIAAWMIVFAVGAFLIFRATNKREPFYVYAGVSIVMLAAATAVELKGAVLTIAYTVEAGIITLTAQAILKDLRITRRLSLIFLLPIIMSGDSLVSYAWRNKALLNDHFFVLLILAALLTALGLFIREKQIDEKDRQEKWFPALLFIISSLYIYRLLWLSLHNLIATSDTAVTLALFIYTVIGLASYIIGQFKELKALTRYGGVMLGLVVGRLLLVEVWQMDLAWRIVTFFITGTLLAGTAFIGRKQRKIESLSKT